MQIHPLVICQTIKYNNKSIWIKWNSSKTLVLRLMQLVTHRWRQSACPTTAPEMLVNNNSANGRPEKDRKRKKGGNGHLDLLRNWISSVKERVNEN